MTGIAVIGLIVAVMVVLAVANAGVSASIETLFDVMMRSSPDRKRLNPTFVTSLSAADAFGAAREAASAASATEVVPLEDGRALLITFGSGARVNVRASTTTREGVRLRLAPGSRGTGDADMARFRGSLLAALRSRDPEAQQK
jgi:hypothetical protein